MSNNNFNITVRSLVRQGDYTKVDEFLREYGLNVDDENWYDYEALIDAIKIKNAKIVQLLLNHGCRIIKPRAKVCCFPLHEAVNLNCTEIVKMLLQHGANPSSKANKVTPLHFTINYNQSSIEIVKLLLEYKANVCVKGISNETPIHRAFHCDRPSRSKHLDLMLLAHEGKVTNCTDDQGVSIFHIACTRNLPSIVENFLQNKVDVHTRVNTRGNSWNGFTGLHFAGMYYQVDVIKVLLKYKVDVNTLCNRGLSALWMAVKYIFKDDIAHKLNESLVKNKATYEEIRVHQKEIMKLMSNEIRNIETVQLLLECKSNVNLVNKKGHPLLFEACFPRTTLNFSDEIPNKAVIESICNKFAFKSRKKIVKMLINHGIDVNVVAGDTRTILHYVANHFDNLPGCGETIEMILMNGGNPNIKNKDGHTPLHLAVIVGCYKYVSLLLKYKADPNSTDQYLCTPLHYARCQRIIKALIDCGANVKAKDKQGRVPSLKTDRDVIVLPEGSIMIALN